jgi:enoyl-CoA hydratase
MTTYKNIEIDHPADHPGVALLRLDRPAKLNALNRATLVELESALVALTGDPQVRAVVVTGSGDKAFCAGADIREIQDLQSAGDASELSRVGQAVCNLIEQMPKPVVMAVNGMCFGGGCELALAGDVRVAAETAQFAQPEIDLGILPGFGGTQRLPRLVGRDRAKKLMMTGERISAAEAYRLGLVDHVAPPDQLLLQALNLATYLAGKAPIALALIKEAVNSGVDLPLPDGLELEAQLFARAAATTDRVEGTTAFLEKRKPVWTGHPAQEADAALWPGPPPPPPPPPARSNPDETV